jgi:hypothetical protein
VLVIARLFRQVRVRAGTLATKTIEAPNTLIHMHIPPLQPPKHRGTKPEQELLKYFCVVCSGNVAQNLSKTESIMSQSIAGAQIEHNGKTMALSEWAHELGLSYATVRMRYTRGIREPQRLFASTRFYRAQKPPQQVSAQLPNHTLLDDLFPKDIAAEIRAAAEELGVTPMQVVVQIVTKRIEKLREQKPQ